MHIDPKIITTHRDALAARKDAFWARKTVYMVGLAIIIGASRDEHVDTALKMLAADVAADMTHEYPQRDNDELQAEFIKDCEEFKQLLYKAVE